MDNKHFSRHDLDKLICQVMKIDSITPTINKQINRFVMENNLTWLQIARTVSWYVDTAKQKADVKYGIWFVPKYVHAAEKYFHDYELVIKGQKEEAKKAAKIQANNIIFHIKPRKTQKRKPKRFPIEEIDVTGGNND